MVPYKCGKTMQDDGVKQGGVVVHVHGNYCNVIGANGTITGSAQDAERIRFLEAQLMEKDRQIERLLSIIEGKK